MYDITVSTAEECTLELKHLCYHGATVNLKVWISLLKEIFLQKGLSFSNFICIFVVSVIFIDDFYFDTKPSEFYGMENS